MSAIIESLPVSEIGERLRIAREAAGLTQAAAAEKIDVARTTIVAIERGQRRIKTNELQGLCSLYGTSANAILRQEAVHLDMVPRFRKLAQSADDAAEQAAAGAALDRGDARSGQDAARRRQPRGQGQEG